MTKQKQFLHACALLRRLQDEWRREPPHSYRNTLLDYALRLAPPGIEPAADVSDEYFKSLRKHLEDEAHEPRTEPVAKQLDQASYPTLLVLLVETLLTLSRRDTTMTERNLIAHAAVLMRPWQAQDGYHFGIMSVHRLTKECERRLPLEQEKVLSVS